MLEKHFKWSEILAELGHTVSDSDGLQFTRNLIYTSARFYSDHNIIIINIVIRFLLIYSAISFNNCSIIIEQRKCTADINYEIRLRILIRT